MPSKSEVATFTQSWNKTVAWAKSRNIPFSDYYPVYQLDAQRMISGTPLSEGSRILAIEAAAHLNYSTALPTDPNQNWTDFRSNTISNAQDIFVGLEPTHLISNIWDTVAHTVTHPLSLVSPLTDIGRILDPFNNHQQTVNAMRSLGGDLNKSVYDFIPGVADVGNYAQAGGGTAGFAALARQPLSTLIDVAPFGRVGSEALGRLPSAENLAGRLGMSVADLRKVGLWRIGGKFVKTLPGPNALLTRMDHPYANYTPDAETGMRTMTGINNSLTIGQFWEYMKQKLGASAEGADIVKERFKANAEGTREVEHWLTPAYDAFANLTHEEYNQLQRWIQTDFRTLEERMNDHNVPIKLRTALEPYWDWTRQFDEIKMAAKEKVIIPSQFEKEDGSIVTVPEEYYTRTPQYSVVNRALEQSTKDQENFDEVSLPLTKLLYQIDQNDHNMAGVFEVINQNTKDIYASMQRSIPAETNPTAAERMTSTLPAEQRWNRAVSQQTPLIRNLLGLGPNDKLTIHMVNALRDLFSSGGLLEQAYQAYKDEDWVKLNKVTKAAVRKFKSQALSSIPREGRATLHKIYRITENLQKYAAGRGRMAARAERMSKTVEGATLKAHKSHQAFLKAVVMNPPDVWRNVSMEVTTKRLAQSEKTVAAMEDTTKALSAQGWKDSELTHLRENERNLLEIMTNANAGTNENGMLPDIDHGESIQVWNDWYHELSSLRARGEKPLYVPEITVHDVTERDPTYNIFLKGTQARRPSATFGQIWGYTPSIYDLRLGMLKTTKEMVEKDHLDHFINQELIPRLTPTDEVHAILKNYYKTEIDALNVLPDEAARTEGALTIIARGQKKLGYVGFDPEKMFGTGFEHPSLNQPYLIHKDLLKVFQQTIDKWQFPAQGIMDRGTQLFRFSILGLSPRYTAHIVFGGTFLLALRGTPGMLRFIPQALYFALHNSFDEKTMRRFPYAQELSELGVTNEGLSMARYHFAAMNSAGRNWAIPEWLDRKMLSDTYKNRVRAAADINLRFTRAVVRAQKAVTYLDAAARAEKSGTIDLGDWVLRQPSEEGSLVDAKGRPITHPVTGRPMHDYVVTTRNMTKDLAHQEGMLAVAKVMGDLRHMTPLERGIFQRIFPFYGWTKHILKYVMSYPFDHPWRAMILTQLAMQNAEDTASGLPLRLGLLTFLGQPDQYGNVTAIDTKSLDPLRDTANYASFTGFFESLNPAITGVGALVDPQFSFAGQNLYPKVTYSDLYGVKTAAAGGSAYNVAEQFVPQLTALDEAFNLSGQYGYLAKNPQAFDKKLFESLGLPLTPENINLRQIAAQGEIDRASIAANAAYEAATTGDLSYLQGYSPTAELPDPLNTQYNITPAYIKAMTQESEDKYNLPFYQTATRPPNPPLNR
jgi:hypothetical protein